MPEAVLRFGPFELSPVDRLLTRDGERVDVSSRYLDALILLTARPGALVTKARFMDEVWAGVPVTDEALTQCIRALRRALDDDAARPQYIETAPKHGYRFIAPVERLDLPRPAAVITPTRAVAATVWPEVFDIGRAGMIGGGAAGLIGGVIYGVIAATPGGPAGAGLSAVVVVAGLSLLVGLLGGGGIGFGAAAVVLAPGRARLTGVLGAGFGGLMIGAVFKLVGLDALNLLVGQAPIRITGAAEGALLGLATGVGLVLTRRLSRGRTVDAWISAGLGALAGGMIVAGGGRLMGGSLMTLAAQFPSAGLRLGGLAAVFGDGWTGGLATVLEAALLVTGVTLAIRRTEARP